MRDFTIGTYNRLCAAIQELRCPVWPLRDYLRLGQPPGFAIILRHDVDRNLDSALRLAALEADYGFSATYYFRTTPAVFQRDAIQRVRLLNHEVGYHYEVLSKARGDRRRAAILFQHELNVFRQMAPVDTISMHGSPLLPWHNLELWQTLDWSDYGLLGEAYLSVDYRRVYYFTDTGRGWDAHRFNIRDRVVCRRPPDPVHGTPDLIAFLRTRPAAPVIINAHPNRWAHTDRAWFASLLTDWTANSAKFLLALLYRALFRP
ncbi:MAG: hypothetical protein H6650_07180 [Ardenticatenales bacterium]|nr:hypothetical protein [Ardenticatenales bacterium]